MTLAQLQYFQLTAQHLNFRKAADIANISQPSLSNAISKLEDELGFYLFDRKGKHVELTRYGKYYYEQITPLLRELNDVTEQVKRFASTSEGQIDIAYNAPLSREFIPKNVRAFLEIPQNQNLSIHLHQTTSSHMIQRLSEGYLDVGFCNRVPAPDFISFIPIQEEAILIITPLDHPLADKEAVYLHEIEPYPLIAYTKESALRQPTLQFLAEAEVRPQIAIEAPDEDAIAALVAEKFGVAIVADVPALAHANVKRIPIRGKICSRTICMAYNTYSTLTPAVSRFMEFMRKRAMHGKEG